jgi:hypothetical protein
VTKGRKGFISEVVVWLWLSIQVQGQSAGDVHQEGTLEIQYKQIWLFLFLNEAYPNLCIKIMHITFILLFK